MKRYAVHLVAALITFSIGLGVSWFTSKLLLRNHDIATISPADSRCTHDKIQIEQQLGSGAGLSVVEATCGKYSSSVILRIQNIGPKEITAYKVAITQDFARRRGVRSAQSVTSHGGFALKVGEAKTLTLGGGFPNDTGCWGNRIGALQRSIFWVQKLEFADGTSWESNL